MSNVPKSLVICPVTFTGIGCLFLIKFIIVLNAPKILTAASNAITWLPCDGTVKVLLLTRSPKIRPSLFTFKTTFRTLTLARSGFIIFNLTV